MTLDEHSMMSYNDEVDQSNARTKLALLNDETLREVAN